MFVCSGRRFVVSPARRAISIFLLLVDVDPGRTLLDLIAFEQNLEEVLGCSVQMLTDAGLSPYLQQRILAEAAAL
jgi:uncharacterized protein